MKHFIIDFISLDFSKYKVHGGGNFALRLIDYLIKNNISFSIINNKTEYYQNYSNSKVLNGVEVIYFNPIYNGKIDRTHKYDKIYLYVHGLRMLEQPFDRYTYKYYSFPNNLFFYLKYLFLSSYYKNEARNLLNSIKNYGENANILTPSIHSKYVFLSQKGFNHKVNVLPPFIGEDIVPDENDLPESRYLLFLNGDRWVKNSFRFLKAYQELKEDKKLKDLNLIMVGKPRFSNKFSLGVTYLDYISREKLEGLMKNCLCLVYPSLNEGFGYPPVDCFKYNKPVISTSVSAPNIIYNGTVVFTNPYSITEIKSRLLYMADNLEALNKENYRITRDEIIKDIEAKWSKVFS